MPFISIEGPDGVGKTTVVNKLKEMLPDALFIREPGTTEAGIKIRQMLLEDHYKLEVESELLLFVTSFAETSSKVIRPALESSKLVIADRWYYSTIAYQAHATDNKLNSAMLYSLIPFANVERPSLNIILLASWEVLQERLLSRNVHKDKMESRPESFRRAVYDYYFNERHEKNTVEVRTEGSIDSVVQHVYSIITCRNKL